MSLLGKLLAVFNVLAAGVFLYLATLDYAKRQAWSDAVVQHDLLIQGLPVDSEERDLEGRVRLEQIRPALLKSMLERSGAPLDPPTQEAEVDRVKQKVEAFLNDTTTPQNKGQKLARVLLSLATTAEDRQKLMKRMADAKPDPKGDEILQAQLDSAFAAAKGPMMTIKRPDSSLAQAERDAEQKKYVIAHLLFRLADFLRQEERPPATASTPDSKAYERYLAVVGLQAATHELDGHTQYLQQMAQDLQTAIQTDREAFADQHKRLHGQIRDIAARVGQQKYLLDLEKKKVVAQEELVKQRKTDVDEVTKQLAAARRLSADELKEQAALEQSVFKNRQILRDAFYANQELEQQLRVLEQGR